MGKKLIIGFLILILVGGGYWYINQSKGELPPPFIPEGEKAVTLYHKKEGTNTHIYSGFLALATPCEQIETTVSNEKTWWKKELTYDDLKIKSPYNTYINAGLPPSPICNPGIAAIQAVVNAPDTNYIYYISDAKGTLHPAATLEEHNKNISKYLGK
jgi:hypothetical protein